MQSGQRLSLIKIAGIWIVLVLLSGCAAGTVNVNASQPDRVGDQALLSIYLESRGNCGTDVSAVLDELSLHGDRGDFPLYLEPVSIQVRHVQGKQQLLGLVEVPPGYYDRLDLTYTTSPENEQSLSLRLPKSVSLEEGGSQCLFVTWHLDACADGQDASALKFSARGQESPLAGDLLYVLSDTIRTLYLVSNDTRFVVAAIGLAGEPGEMEVDAEDQRLYLLSRSGKSLQVFDLANHRLLDRLPLPLALKPEALALDRENNFAYVSDALSRRVLKIDLESGQMAASREMDLPPGSMAFVERESGGLLAVSVPHSQNVYLLSSETLAIQKKVDTGFQPEHLISVGGNLLVAETGSQTVTAFDTASGQYLGRVHLVGQPGEMLADNDKVYISNAQTSRLAVLATGQLTVLRNVPAGHSPGALALSGRHGLLYVGSTVDGTVTVIDRASEYHVGTIPVAGRVQDLAVFE